MTARAGIQCRHCLLPVAESSALVEEIDGERALFCCAGCRAVYRLLRGRGLEEFYRRRRGWTPGPPEPAPIEPDAFADSVSESPRGGLQASIAVSGTRCAACGWLIERYLSMTQGVLDARMNFAAARLFVRWDPSRTRIETIAARIRELGYTPLPDDGAATDVAFEAERRDLLVRLGTAAFLSSQIMMYTAGLYAGYFQGIDGQTRAVFRWIAVLLAAPVLFYAGRPFLSGAVAGLRRRAPGMDLLVALGASSAYVHSVAALATGDEVYVDTTAMIVTLVLFGRFIEARARRAVPPDDAPAALELVPPAALRPGDEFEVAPGERIPADGTVTGGETDVDEAMLTGESRPVPKHAGDTVLAGTVNGGGRIVAAAVRTGRKTVLSQIVRAVDESQSKKSPIQAAADRWAAAFVPAIAFLAVLTATYWVRAGAPFSRALMTGVSVLVIACPCALGLATPLAVSAGSIRARQAGVLVRAGLSLEAAARIDTVFLDKTGTVTEGRPRVTDVVAAGMSENGLLRIAASLEAPAEHPLAGAVLRAAADAGVTPASAAGWSYHPGHGVSGVVDGAPCRLGNARFVEEGGARIAASLKERANILASEGKTVVFLSVADRAAGLLAAADAPRSEAAAVVGELRGRGIEVVLLSGDRADTARRAAAAVGIDRVEAPVDPLGKAAIVRSARAAGRRVMMAGDGVNDAPALAEADAGVAMGRGADAAAASAGAIMLRDDLRALPEFLDAARATSRVIRENLAWAFSYNLVAVPLAASGRLHPIAAAAFMAASSLLVVGNSARLRRAKV